MKTTQIRPDYQISITEISPDSDQLEIVFTATLTAGYVRSTAAFIDAPTHTPDWHDDYSDIDDYSDDQPYATYELNVALRHAHGLYFILQNEPFGDTIDTYEQAIFAFGQPIIDFVTDACKLLNIPFFPNN
jgi:hypothetical protein